MEASHHNPLGYAVMRSISKDSKPAQKKSGAGIASDSSAREALNSTLISGFLGKVYTKSYARTWNGFAHTLF